MPDWKIVAIEEHFTSPKLRELIAPRDGPTQQKLNDLGGVRIKEMDDAGIDLAVLSENMKPSAPTRAGLPASRRCRCPTRRPRPTSWSAASASSASLAPW